MAKVMIIVPDRDRWRGANRGQLFLRHLLRAGHDADLVSTRQPPKAVADFDLVFNHAFAVAVEKFRPVMEANPGTQFVHVNHSALGYLESTPQAARQYTSAIWASRTLRNCWAVSQDENGMNAATGLPRVCQMPAAAHLLEPRENHQPGNPLRVVIAGRACPIKNVFAAVVACAAMRKEVELRFAMKPTREVNLLLKALQLRALASRMLPHADWLSFLKSSADVVLAPSLAESFNYVACEAGQLGVPVVGTSCVRSADPELSVLNPSEPLQIVDSLRKIADNYTYFAKRAAVVARSAAERQNAGFAEFVKRVLGSGKQKGMENGIVQPSDSNGERDARSGAAVHSGGNGRHGSGSGGESAVEGSERQSTGRRYVY